MLKKKNIWIYIAICSLLLNVLFIGYINRTQIKKQLEKIGLGGYSYEQNEQYSTFLKMYKMNTEETDIVFLGDSITFQGAFDEFFPDKRVLNRGIGSDTSKGVLNRLDEVIVHNPKAVFLMIGINDLGHYISEDDIVLNVQMIIENIKAELPDCQIYIESVLPTATIDLKRIESLNTRYKEIADAENRCEYIELYDLFMDNDRRMNTDLFRADGVHLAGDSYAIWINAIENEVEKY